MDLHAVCRSLLLLTCTGICFGQELLLPEITNGTEGGNVVITPIRIPDGTYTLIRWMYKTHTILLGPPGGITIRPPYTNRVNLDITSLALELRSLTENDTGEYSLTVDTVTNSFTNVTSLQVFGIFFGQELLLPEITNGTEGENVVITPIRIPDGTYTHIRWMYKTHTILLGPPGGITIRPPYTNRVHLDITTLALELRSLTQSDTGEYSLTVDTVTHSFRNATSLQVFGPTGGDEDSLSAGAIAGIVIGVLLGLAGIAGLIFYFMKAKEITKPSKNKQNGATHIAQQEDSHYVNVTGVAKSTTDTQLGHTTQPENDPIYEN